jgi:hypothetical protein
MKKPPANVDATTSSVLSPERSVNVDTNFAEQIYPIFYFKIVGIVQLYA